MLSLDDILKADALPAHKVSVPEWGGDVYVATLRADERDVMEARLAELQEGGSAGIRAYVVAFCLCNEKGERLCVNQLDFAASMLGKKSAPSVQRVFDVCSKVNAITEADRRELEKNSYRTRSCSGNGESLSGPASVAPGECLSE